MRWHSFLAVSAALIPLSSLIGTNAVFGRPPHPVKAISHTIPVAAVSAPVRYREQVEPLFKTECLTCHSSGIKSGGLALDTPAGLLAGGAKTGATMIVPGHAAQSGLIAYLRGQRQPRMPFGKPALPAADIARLAAWIDGGAKIDPIKILFPYTHPVAYAPPVVQGATWVRNPIDQFILAKLEAKRLHPAPPASKVALMRRVYEDLVGMPPTPTEADRYLTDTSPDAYDKLVDRLLADPRYGERWGRHWLDLVRYAETQGFEHDTVRPHAWRYRDYVIRSFNADKPYDRFLKEQIAGDELYPTDPDAIVATGFARLGPWDELSTDPKQRWQDYLNDATDTTGAVFLGMTVGCARCHDHKYDRITQADYYRLEAFFASTKWADVRLPSNPDSSALQAKIADPKARRDALQKQIDEEREKVRGLMAALTPGKAVSDSDLNAALLTSPYEQNRHNIDTWSQQRDDAEREYQPYEPVAEAIADKGARGEVQHILLRGDLLQPGPAVEPGFVASLDGGQVRPAPVTPPAGGQSTGRRTALANWLASPENPMTARVIVNRLWQHHFGRGIVASPSDFGVNGEKPTHPELLDYLAVRFMKDGWSIKKMQRLMLLSATYRQATDAVDPRTTKLDPNNALFSRMNRIRLEGEALRDSILAVSGRLNPEQGGPSVYPHVSDEVLSTGSTHKWGTSPADQELRRTVYVFQRRSLMLPLVEAFDGADMSNTCPRRSATTIAPQALALFNGEFSRTESAHFAERVAREAGPNPAGEIAQAYRIALCRTPTPSQQARALAFLTRKEKLYLAQSAVKRDAGKAQQMALSDLCHVLINVNEFIYLD
jgi:mono/diheme cytochrome c family protein